MLKLEPVIIFLRGNLIHNYCFLKWEKTRVDWDNWDSRNYLIRYVIFYYYGNIRTGCLTEFEAPLFAFEICLDSSLSVRLKQTGKITLPFL